MAANDHLAALPEFDSDTIQIRPGVRLNQRLGSHRTQVGGRSLHANVLQRHQHRTFVAIESVDDDGTSVIYYGLLVLCFTARYLGESRQLCYVN